MSKRLLGLLLAIAGPFLWGSSGIVAEDLFNHKIDTIWLVAIRMLISGILLLAYGMLKNEDIFQVYHNKMATIKLLLFSVLGMTSVQVTYFMAIAKGNAATATILQYTSPVMVIVYLALRNWQRPTRVEIISVISAIIGTFLIVTQGNFSGLAIPLSALIWGLLSAVGAALYTLMPISLLKIYDAVPIVGWSMLIGGLLIGIFDQVWNKTPQLTMVMWLEVIFVIIFGTMLAFLFYLQSLAYIDPTTASVLGAVEPLTAMILGVLFMHVVFNGYGILGAVLVIGVTGLQFLGTKESY
ncbi:DMT family transporter [Companilactobacillus keshanensis]|uniref:DMT family transporter n=1 Tax=Companilactobacillus keshanensis TaxID=2486003 RepID=A0ABW4BQP1_9LACO|nr:DMT family transporter [Companilactobacillus keshanensis]